jgi:hypothetical protein
VKRRTCAASRGVNSASWRSAFLRAKYLIMRCPFVGGSPRAADGSEA